MLPCKNQKQREEKGQGKQEVSWRKWRISEPAMQGDGYPSDCAELFSCGKEACKMLGAAGTSRWISELPDRLALRHILKSLPRSPWYCSSYVQTSLLYTKGVWKRGCVEGRRISPFFSNEVIVWLLSLQILKIKAVGFTVYWWACVTASWKDRCWQGSREDFSCSDRHQKREAECYSFWDASVLIQNLSKFQDGLHRRPESGICIFKL